MCVCSSSSYGLAMKCDCSRLSGGRVAMYAGDVRAGSSRASLLWGALIKLQLLLWLLSRLTFFFFHRLYSDLSPSIRLFVLHLRKTIQPGKRRKIPIMMGIDCLVAVKHKHVHRGGLICFNLIWCTSTYNFVGARICYQHFSVYFLDIHS